MKALLRPILVIVWKDVLLELRSKDLLVSVVVFGLLATVVVASAGCEPPNEEPTNGTTPLGGLWKPSREAALRHLGENPIRTALNNK